MRRTPALIIGAGPAGLAAALTLARSGSSHLVIERARVTGDALCGGFVSWRTLDALRLLGIEADCLNTLGVETFRLFAGGASASVAMHRPALAVSRHRLDSLLLARAEAAGCPIERGVAVRAVDTAVRLAGGSEIAADAVFLASGKHDVRGMARSADACGDDPALGLRLRLPTSAGLTALVGRAIEMHLFERGYAGVVLQEDGSANLCMAVRRSRLSGCGSPAALLRVLGRESPALGERLAYAGTLDHARIDAIANVPYGWRARVGTEGLFRLGDQAGVIDSLAGEGIGIALVSGISAARAFTHGGAESAVSWQGAFSRDTARPIHAARSLRALAGTANGRRLMAAVLKLWPGALHLATAMTRVAGP